MAAVTPVATVVENAWIGHGEVINDFSGTRTILRIHGENAKGDRVADSRLSGLVSARLDRPSPGGTEVYVEFSPELGEVRPDGTHRSAYVGNWTGLQEESFLEKFPTADFRGGNLYPEPIFINGVKQVHASVTAVFEPGKGVSDWTFPAVVDGVKGVWRVSSNRWDSLSPAAEKVARAIGAAVASVVATDEALAKKDLANAQLLVEANIEAVEELQRQLKRAKSQLDASVAHRDALHAQTAGA